jgi:4-hydroxyphenylpyruvate dioxygenase
VTHVIRNDRVVLAFSSPLIKDTDYEIEHTKHLSNHGDGVKDIAFTVENCKTTYDIAISRGAKSVSEPKKLEDNNGYVIVASIQTYGDTIHSFVERKNFKGFFLPGFIQCNEDPMNEIVGITKYNFIDHIVGNHPLGDMEPTVEWYEKMLDFHRFWSVDDSIIHTEYRYMILNI